VRFMGHHEWAARSTHIWYFKGVLHAWGILLDRREGSREDHLLAEYVITGGGDERAQRDCPPARPKWLVERKGVEGPA